MHNSKFEIKYEEETKDLNDLCKKLEKRATSWFDDMKEVDTEEAGEVIDMIKDLYEAKEKIAKTCYYKSIVKAMEKAEEDEEKYREFEKHMMESGEGGQYDRMGYDRWRYANGRFAPKGRGRRTGYTPYVHMMDDMYDDEDYMDIPEMMNYRMGYSGGRNGNSGMSRGGQRGNSGRSEYGSGDGSYGYNRGSQGDSNGQGRSEGSRYGRSYDNYKTAKRYYTESKNPEHQKQMKDNISEMFDDMEEMVQEVWRDMEPAEKQKYKAKMNQMVQKMQ